MAVNWFDFMFLAGVFALLGFLVGLFVGRQSEGAKTVVRKGAGRQAERRERRPEPARRQGNDRGPQPSRERSAPAPSGGTGVGVELYVGNLPYDTTDKELARAFERFGRVLSVRMIENRRNGKPKGFGFVEMQDDATADTAIKAMNGTDFKGRSLVVNEAKSRERD